MNKKFIEVEAGVFQLEPGAQGGNIEYKDGKPLYRFMDSLYIREQNLHLLSPEDVTNLCRARSNNIDLIGGANYRVKEIFRKYLEIASPSIIFEIGAGTLPLMTAAPVGMTYILSDADPKAANEVSDGENFCVFSKSDYKLSYEDNYFDLVVAVFVFQFKVYEQQIKELYRCIGESGIILANVYRRPQGSRADLTKEFKSVGFFVSILDDPEKLCKEHEYWIIGKSESSNSAAAAIFRSIIGI